MSENNDKQVHGLVAQYDSVDTLLDACRQVRDAGYTKTDAFAPFPVHGIETALGIKQTHLPWIVLVCALTGLATGLAMEIWMNAINYPYIISGKPYISLPAFIPVAYELTVLFGCFGAFFGMWALNGLPRFSNPMFTDPRFDRVTDDKFFLYIDAKDDKYDVSAVEQLFSESGGEHITSVVDDDSAAKVPKWFFTLWAVVISASIVPLLVVLKMRVTNSPSPRFHVFFDMDFSPAKDMQTYSSLFADGRAMRPDVPGTVARGEFNANMNLLTGIDMDALAQLDSDRAEQLVAAYPRQLAEEEPAAAPSQAPSVMDTTPWLEENPLDVNMELVERGQQYFGIYCSVCHGMNGGGNGLVSRRARKILAATWIPPSSLHDETLAADKYPDGKLFSTISNGIRKMPGYSSQIKTKDRWAIVAYVRALQRSQNATIDMIPAEQREAVMKQKAEVEQKLKEEAEAAEKAAAERAKAT